MFVRLLVSAAVVLAASCAQAAVHYVSTDGSDANAGTSAEPWATLQHAVDAAEPGDTILVRAGSYAGCRIERSGRPEAPCALKAELGAQVVLDRPGPSSGHDGILEVEHYGATIGHWTIEGFEVANSPHSGIDLRHTEHVTVRRCRVHDSAVTGIITSFSEHVIIESNESYRNHEHGIYHANSADYPTIRGNRIHHNDTCGIHMNGDASMGGDGQISHGLVERNIVWENGEPLGGSAINCDGVSDSIFRNNLCVGNHASGISLYAGDGAEGSSRNQVYNNTFLMAPGSRWVVNIPASRQGKPNPVGNIVKNNVLYTPWLERGAIYVYDPVGAGLESDYNAVVGRFRADGGGAMVSLREWRRYGLDQHSIQITPEALTGGDAGTPGDGYRPGPGSPLVGAGVPLAEVSDDLSGGARPATPSIGCYEPLAGREKAPASPGEWGGTGGGRRSGTAGIAAKYPGDAGIEEDPAVLLYEGFEAPVKTVGWMEPGGWFDIEIGAGRGAEISDTLPAAGRGCLQFNLKQGRQGSGAMFHLIEPSEVVYFRYYRRFEEDWQWPEGYGPHDAMVFGGRFTAPTNTDLSIYADFWMTGDTVVRIASAGQKLGYGGWHEYLRDRYPRPKELDPPGSASIPWNRSVPAKIAPGRWHCVEVMVRLSGPGKEDGEVRLWVNGKLVSEYTDLPLRDADHPELKLNMVFLAPYFHPGSPRDQTHWADAIAVATEYIGPISDGPDEGSR